MTTGLSPNEDLQKRPEWCFANDVLVGCEIMLPVTSKILMFQL